MTATIDNLKVLWTTEIAPKEIAREMGELTEFTALKACETRIGTLAFFFFPILMTLGWWQLGMHGQEITYGDVLHAIEVIVGTWILIPVLFILGAICGFMDPLESGVNRLLKIGTAIFHPRLHRKCRLLLKGFNEKYALNLTNLQHITLIIGHMEDSVRKPQEDLADSIEKSIKSVRGSINQLKTTITALSGTPESPLAALNLSEAQACSADLQALLAILENQEGECKALMASVTKETAFLRKQFGISLSIETLREAHKIKQATDNAIEVYGTELVNLYLTCTKTLVTLETLSHQVDSSVDTCKEVGYNPATEHVTPLRQNA